MQRPGRRQQEERLFGRLRIGQQQRALAEVVEQQRRQHQREPGDADRPLAEVAHVGVQRLAAGDHQEHRAEHREAVPAVLAEERRTRDAGSTAVEHDRLAARSTITPSTAITTNQTTIIGPNSRPTRCVPCCWIAKTPIRITTAIGTTYGSKSGVATFSPSTAPSTVIAGVIMPSP